MANVNICDHCASKLTEQFKRIKEDTDKTITVHSSRLIADPVLPWKE